MRARAPRLRTSGRKKLSAVPFGGPNKKVSNDGGARWLAQMGDDGAQPWIEVREMLLMECRCQISLCVRPLASASPHWPAVTCMYRCKRVSIAVILGPIAPPLEHWGPPATGGLSPVWEDAQGAADLSDLAIPFPSPLQVERRNHPQHS